MSIFPGVFVSFCRIFSMLFLYLSFSMMKSKISLQRSGTSGIFSPQQNHNSPYGRSQCTLCFHHLFHPLNFHNMKFYIALWYPDKGYSLFYELSIISNLLYAIFLRTVQSKFSFAFPKFNQSLPIRRVNSGLPKKERV